MMVEKSLGSNLNVHGFEVAKTEPFEVRCPVAARAVEALDDSDSDSDDDFGF